MDINEVFRKWLQYAEEQYAAEAPDLLEELKALDPVKDAEEIYDRFYTYLDFGTGGLRVYWVREQTA